MKAKNGKIWNFIGLFFVVLTGFAMIFLIGEVTASPEKNPQNTKEENRISGASFGSGIGINEDDPTSNPDPSSAQKIAEETPVPEEKSRNAIEPDEEVKNALMIGDQNVIDQAMLHQYKRLNTETVGIIRINNTVLNHPLMQSASQENFYLNHDVLKRKNGNGTPFLTLASDLSKESGNNVIYGHNIRYGRKDVFEPLSGYEKLSFYKEHPTVEIVTEGKTESYLVFAYYLIDTADEDAFVYWISPSWDDEAEFEEYMAEVEKRNWLDTKIPYSIADRYITLSACSVELAHSGTNRMVVMARRKRDGEYPILYAQNATLKASPYLPQKLRND